MLMLHRTQPIGTLLRDVVHAHALFTCVYDSYTVTLTLPATLRQPHALCYMVIGLTRQHILLTPTRSQLLVLTDNANDTTFESSSQRV